MKEKFSMKDAAFNSKNISKLADDIKNTYAEFNKDGFLENILIPMDSLELKERSQLITKSLFTFLPKDYEISLDILFRILPIPLDAEGMEGFDSFVMMPITGFVSAYGLEHFERSTLALYEMTKRFTAEFDIRFFIEKYPLEMISLLMKWTQDKNMHVRRLVSEGTRPRLPWAFQLKAFIKDPREVLPLLTALKDDKELYVRRSVANNLNDISKDHPRLVIDTLTLWQDGSKNMKWISKNALRTLIKKGDKRALEFLGYVATDALEVELILNKKVVYFGESVEFEVSITSLSEKPQALMIDFIVYYQKANGSLSPKVFKLKQLMLERKKSVVLKKKHKFSDLSTRKHYEGEHKIAVQINGEVYKKVTLSLLSQ